MSRGPFPYEDVYLDEQRSSEEEENDISETPSKPLMSGRKKSKIQLRDPKPKPTWYYRRKKCCLRIFYSLLALISLILFVFVLVKVVKDAVTMGKNEGLLQMGHGSSTGGGDELIPCDGFDVEQVWVNNFPTLTTETAVRMVDVNRDGILDVILGFGTMAYGLFRDQYLLCKIYYEGESLCFGGMMALDGVSGKEIWRHYSIAEIFAVNCEEDIDLDGVKDCLGAGRAGEFELVNGATGEQMWTFENNVEVREYVSNLYTPQYIDDIDNDNIPDIINVHGGDPARDRGEEVRSVAKVIIFSGKTGAVLAHSHVPDGEESYYSPQVYSKGDGSKVVLFGTGGETRGGSLFAVPLENVTAGSITKAKKLYSNSLKGVMTPPVLVDLTNDGVVDIVCSIFNGTVIALNGETYEVIWNTTVPFSESYSTPGAGYFNDDDIPDFMIIFNYGPGYPLYYYSQVTILDGKTGIPLIDPAMKMSGSVQSSSLSISFEGFGNDAFIYWGLLCEGHEHETTGFTFAEGVYGPAMSRVNFCKERFGTKDVTRQFILNQNMKLPGDVLYDSKLNFDIEHSNKLNATILAIDFLKDHPEIKDLVIKDALERHHSHSDKTDEHPSRSKMLELTG
ncbi:hypothetical protein HOLleu_21012 [Holothuria leucospilota]|uniref:FAM234A/B beta-propeller domain-containing protein n=1 Tax=Holothuria leucospilota TaxID=206669 RepID=A0A9Q1BWW3_HOLLE|nr:hypothetical protein HOLleu_21012 [Holothuria leucospilota]